MKKILVISGLLLAVALGAQAQGVINFSSAGAGVNARFATSGPGGSNLLTSAMSNFRADFFWATGSTTVGVDPSTLSGSDLNQAFSSVAAQAGFFSGGSKTINGATPGVGVVGQVRVWDTTFGSYAAAKLAQGSQWFESPLFLITPALVPPNTPPNLVGLGSGVIYSLNYNAVPEPSSIVLAGLGAASLLLFRRRK